MKTKCLLLYLFLLVVTLSSCSKKSDLSNAIPVDALYVVRVDAQSMIKKSEYDVFKNPIVQQGVNFAKPFLKDDQKKLLDNFLKDANALGIDLKNEYYVYATGKEFGLVVKMIDAKKFNDNLKTISSEDKVVTENGVYALASYKSAVVWNNDKLVFVSRDLPYNLDANSKKEDEIMSYAKNLLTQSEDNSISSVKEYNRFLAEAKDISAFYSLGNIMKWAELNSKQDSLANEVATTVFKEFDGVSAAAYLNFDKGNLVTTQDFLYNSDNTEKRFKSFVNQFVAPIKGELLKYVPENNIFLASANLNGKNLENYLTSIKAFDLANERTADSIPDKSRQLLKCIDGDITFFISDIKINKESGKKDEVIEAVDVQLDKDSLDYDVFAIDRVKSNTSHDFDNMVVDMGIFANVSDADFVAAMLEENAKDSSSKIEILSPRVYKLTEDPKNTVYFGLKNNLFFATTLPSVYEAVIAREAISNAYKGDKHNEDLFFIKGDFNKFVSIILSSSEVANLRDIDKYIQLFNLIQGYQFSAKANTLSMSGNVTFNNKTQNSLKTICYAIDDLTKASFSNILGNLF